MANENLKMGVKIQKDNRETFCRELRNLVKDKKIVMNEKRSFDELSSFGISSTGRYESQLSHDDVAMTCVNLVSLFDTTDYYEMVEEKYDNTSQIYKLAVEHIMSQGDRGEDDFLAAFKTIKSFESPTPYVLPKDPMSHNYRMR
jgi:hypothetical protein